MSMCREVRLVAELLYSGLTTGAGLQTLGEEYCDILQAAGALVHPLDKLCSRHTSWLSLSSLRLRHVCRATEGARIDVHVQGHDMPIYSAAPIIYAA